MKLNYTAILLVFLVLVSCEFEPSGEYYSDVKEPRVLPPIVIDLNAENDTIYISSIGSILFELNTGGREIMYLEICISDQVVILSHSMRKLNISEIDVQPGTHKLIVNIITESGTGSIADILNAEGFSYSKEFTLIIREWSCDWAGSLSVNPDQGSLKLSWEKYNGANFQEYVLTKRTDWGSMTLAKITDPKVTSLYDSTYIGGNATYNIELVTFDNSPWDEVSYTGKLPKVHIKEVNNNLMTLVWDKSRYIENIERYEIYKFTWDHRYELIAEITDPNDTSSIFDNLMFLHEYEILFLPIPKYFFGDNLSSFFSQMRYLGSKTYGHIGDRFSYGTIVTAIGDYFYFPAGHYIYEYSYIEDRATRTIELISSNSDFAVSANRKFILAADNRRSILLYNFSKSESYSLEQFAGEFNMVSAPAISDNGIGIMRLYNFGSTFSLDGNILIYDFVNERKIFQGPVGQGITSSFSISADGKYFCRNLRSVYQILSDTVILVQEITNEITNSTNFEFHPADPELFVYRKDDYLYMKRISDLSTTFSFHMPYGFLVNIDYNVNKFLAHSGEKLRLYDLNSCEEVWSYPASPVISSYTGVRFCYNAIYDSRLGVRLKLNN